MSMHKDIMERMSLLEKNTTQILFILESNNKTNQKGLVETVEEEKDKLNNLLTREKVFLAKASVYGTIGGILASAIIWITHFIID